MDRVADQFGFVVVYPKGQQAAEVLGHKLPGYTHNGGGCCSSACSDGPGRLDDVAFARALVGVMPVAINRSRIYSTGFSNGGFMSYRLGCEAPDLVAAIAPVSAILANNPNFVMKSSQKFECDRADGRNVPVLHIHGTKDQLVTYAGNPFFQWGSVVNTVKDWATANHCNSSSSDHGGGSYVPTTTFQNRSNATNNSVLCQNYCGGGSSNVTLCTVVGGTHAWPGGRCGGTFGPCTLTIPDYCTLHMAGEALIHAADEIWRFFSTKTLQVKE